MVTGSVDNILRNVTMKEGAEKRVVSRRGAGSREVNYFLRWKK